MKIEPKLEINIINIALLLIVLFIILGAVQKFKEDLAKIVPNLGGLLPDPSIPAAAPEGPGDRPALPWWQFIADLFSNFGVRTWEVPKDKF